MFASHDSVSSSSPDQNISPQIENPFNEDAEFKLNLGAWHMLSELPGDAKNPSTAYGECWGSWRPRLCPALSGIII